MSFLTRQIPSLLIYRLFISFLTSFFPYFLINVLSYSPNSFPPYLPFIYFLPGFLLSLVPYLFFSFLPCLLPSRLTYFLYFLHPFLTVGYYFTSFLPSLVTSFLHYLLNYPSYFFFLSFLTCLLSLLVIFSLWKIPFLCLLSTDFLPSLFTYLLYFPSSFLP